MGLLYSSLNLDQVSLWQDNGSSQSFFSGDRLYYHTYPLTYDSTFQRYIFLAGFKFSTANTLSYRLQVSPYSASSDEIFFTINHDLIVYYISFRIGLIKQTFFVYMQDLGIKIFKLSVVPNKNKQMERNRLFVEFRC